MVLQSTRLARSPSSTPAFLSRQVGTLSPLSAALPTLFRRLPFHLGASANGGSEKADPLSTVNIPALCEDNFYEGHFFTQMRKTVPECEKQCQNKWAEEVE